jgi:hypothetical protein
MRSANAWSTTASAVQDAVRQALETYGLDVTLVDRGYDYAVSLPTPDGFTIEDAAVWFEVGPYFVEVKATRSGAPKLTPAQADTASSQPTRYVLCVVDLRDVEDDRLDGEWSGGDVEPLASFVPDIGAQVLETCVLVREARASIVGIRNEAALRYEVPTDVWESGASLREWVAQIVPELK